MEKWSQKPAVYDQTFEDYKKRMYEAGKDRPKRQFPVETSMAQALYDNRDSDPEAYQTHLNRALPKYEDVQCFKINEDGEKVIDVKERQVTAREIALEEDIRHKSRNASGDATRDRKSVV